MENYKSEIVTVEVFIQNRPDMEIHSPKSITTAILTAATLLNSECNNLINDVWEFNRLQPANPNNDLFRSDYELSQIKEAIISQTQYNLNMGNDFAIGGGSYSIGNVNASYNRPENRPALAPGVLKLLQNARVYVLTDFGKLFNKKTGKDCINPAVAQKDWADAKFLEKHHPNAKVGNVAYIDNQHNINFGNPQDLNITTYRTKLIAGGRGNHQDFYKIDEVPNIAFFGNDDFGTYSAVQRGELKQMGINPIDLKKVWDPINSVYKFINDFDISYWNGITKEQAYFAIYASGTVWRIDGVYRLGWITQKVNALNELRWYESLIDNNVGLDPVTNPQAWKELANQAVDLNQIIDQLKPYIDQVIDGRIDNILDQRKHQFVQETQGQILTFKDQADYEAFRDTNNLVDLDFEDVTKGLETPLQTRRLDLFQSTSNSKRGEISITGDKFRISHITSKNPNTQLVLNAPNSNIELLGGKGILLNSNIAEVKTEPTTEKGIVNKNYADKYFLGQYAYKLEFMESLPSRNNYTPQFNTQEINNILQNKSILSITLRVVYTDNNTGRQRLLLFTQPTEIEGDYFSNDLNLNFDFGQMIPSPTTLLTIIYYDPTRP